MTERNLWKEVYFWLMVPEGEAINTGEVWQQVSRVRS